MGSLKNKEDELEQVGEEAILYVNGVRRILPDGLAHMTLLEYLRGTTWFLKLWSISQIILWSGFV
jgi:hypothetical protein